MTASDGYQKSQTSDLPTSEPNAVTESLFYPLLRRHGGSVANLV